jgi:hypothetical protein
MEPAAPSPPTLVKKSGKKKMIRIAAFVVGGAVMGFGYYKLVGCRTGTCPITSSPIISTMYGALLGYLLGAGG